VDSDVWYANRTVGNARVLRRVVCLHVLNHLFKTKHVILKNNAALKELQMRERLDSRTDIQLIAQRIELTEGATIPDGDLLPDTDGNGGDSKAADGKEDSTKAKKLHRRWLKGGSGKRAIKPLPNPNAVKSKEELAARAAAHNAEEEADRLRRDQGFARPKVLVVLPCRRAAWEYVRTLLELIPHKQRKTVMNKRRFKDEYGPDPEIKVSTQLITRVTPLAVLHLLTLCFSLCAGGPFQAV
jgi:hypothetical protein